MSDSERVSPTSRPVRVVVWYRNPGGDPAAIEAAYHTVSRALDGTPGLVSNELLRSANDSASFAVMSHWQSAEAFDRWERGPSHHTATAPLVPYLDRGPARSFELYEVTAAY
jgi:heme oxygenase (mycobilin-producing)